MVLSTRDQAATGQGGFSAIDQAATMQGGPLLKQLSLVLYRCQNYQSTETVTFLCSLEERAVSNH